MAAKRKRKYLGSIYNKKLHGRGQFSTLASGYFVYDGWVYHANSLPEGTTNLDTVELETEGSIDEFMGCIEDYCPIESNKRIEKKYNLAASLISNVEQCPEVKQKLQW